MNKEEEAFIDRKVGYIKKSLKKLKHYNTPTKLVDEIDKWLVELSYFYNELVKDGQNPSTIMYNIKPSKRPREGQIAYINLRTDP